MNLLDIRDLTESQIREIFELTDQLKRRTDRELLEGKTFLLFFPESSLRTRTTFEKGIKDLGGECILFPPETLDKREALEDVIRYIENWADGVIIRHPNLSKLKELAEYAEIPVINAMTAENHPCEILSDLYSIREREEDYRDLTYTFVGPPGNICKSWRDIAAVVDIDFHHVCTNGNELGADNRNYRFRTDLDEVLKISDVILTDSLPDEWRTKEYIDSYQITLERLQLTKGKAMLNPCPPFFRNEEVSDEAISSDNFVGYAFKKNLIYVQQAILLYCCGIESLGKERVEKKSQCSVKTPQQDTITRD